MAAIAGGALCFMRREPRVQIFFVTAEIGAELFVTGVAEYARQVTWQRSVNRKKCPKLSIS